MRHSFQSSSRRNRPWWMKRRWLIGVALLYIASLASLHVKLQKTTSTGNKSSARMTHVMPNRTIVLLTGNLRCGELAWESLYRNVLDVNNADLALLTQQPSEEYQNASLLERAKFVWTVPDYHDWADAIDLINGNAWRDTVLPLHHNDSILLGGVDGIRGSGAIVFMLRWFLSQRIQELNLTKRYDRFIISRNDHYYLCPHNVSELDSSFMWIPLGEFYGGVTDRHLVVNSEYVLKALDILPPLLANPYRYKEFLQDKYSNSERLLLLRWNEERLYGPKVRFFNRTMFTCMTPGDTSSWETMKERVDEGVHLKYPREYPASQITCNSSTLV